MCIRDRGKTLLEKVYNAYTAEGILTAIDYNVDTEEYTYTVDGKEYTTTQDFSALFAMNVTVLAKMCIRDSFRGPMGRL